MGRRSRLVRHFLVESLEPRVVPAPIVVSSLADTGAGSLRAAIEQANLDTAQDTITFAPAVTGTIALATALPDLSTSIIIDGPGPTALTVARSPDPATPAFGIFTVARGVEVSITGVMITGALESVGGGIYNSGTLALADCTLSGNEVGNFGGGIYSSGTLALADCTLSGNEAGNSGGGIFNDSGTLALANCTLSGNKAGFRGVGIGGGIANYLGATTLTDCTLSGNMATGSIVVGEGGGIGDIFGTMTLTDCTLSGNMASRGGGVSILQLPGQPLAKVTTHMSVFANPAGGNLDLDAGALFVSLGHNLFSDKPAAAIEPTDLVNTDPLLGPLADNGGPTLTQALLPGSPAINAGVAVTGVTTDQRGVQRPQGPAPDIGAFEVEMPPTVRNLERLGVHFHPTTLVVTFSTAMDANRADSRSNYRLVSAGGDHKFGTMDDHTIRIRSVQYNVSSNSVKVRPVHRLPLHAKYQLTIVGEPPGGLTSASGLFLDGAKTGMPGSNYVALITGKLLVPPIQHQR